MLPIFPGIDFSLWYSIYANIKKFKWGQENGYVCKHYV